MFFFFNDTTTSEIYTLSLHDALPILGLHRLKLANALKSALSAVTATVTLVVFGLFGDVHWDVVAVAAPVNLLGGFLRARIATRIPTGPLRLLIVAFGLAGAVPLFPRR